MASGIHGPHSRRSGSSKPKKKERNQPIKIIKNINNNNYIFNNPQIEIKNPQMLGGHIIQTQQYHGQGMNTQFAGKNGITVIKENNIAVGGNMMMQGGSNSSHHPTNMMNRRLADQGHQGGNPQYANNQGSNHENPIIGISGGMVRLKGNSPKVSSKDQNRPRSIK